MASGDELCRQFSAVYPVVVVPALYLIDSSDGVAVEVAAGNKTAKQLAESVKKAVESVRQKKVQIANPVKCPCLGCFSSSSVN